MYIVYESSSCNEDLLSLYLRLRKICFTDDLQNFHCRLLRWWLIFACFTFSLLDRDKTGDLMKCSKSWYSRKFSCPLLVTSHHLQGSLILFWRCVCGVWNQVLKLRIIRCSLKKSLIIAIYLAGGASPRTIPIPEKPAKQGPKVLCDYPSGTPTRFV